MKRHVVSVAALCGLFWSLAGVVNADTLFQRQLDLPASGVSQRVTQRPGTQSGEKIVLFDESGPGCVLHWWLTCDQGQDTWQTVTLIAADRFLVKQGLLTGEPTKNMPASGEKLVPAP